MAAPSPRKFVPLAPGHDPTIPTKSNAPSAETAITKRAFFAAVVVEEDLCGISEDVQELLASLGTRITEQTQLGVDRSASAPSLTIAEGTDLHRSVTTRKRAMTEGVGVPSSGLGHKRTLTQTDNLQEMIKEMVTTERNYVKRLRILKQDYADPLRNFSKKKEEALLDKYKAKTLFGNIDQMLPVNEAFLHDLEKMVGPNGSKYFGGVGDVCLKHFRDMRAFDCYKVYYSKREEAQAIFEEEVAKGGKAGFSAYIERVKYASTDVRNRIGLRELLAEPIQRLPRYTMMWQNMIKEMDESHPQRAKLLEAEKIAGKIAQCESDDQTKRATTMYCLERTIEGFPPGLISNGRRFIDCIDVEDIPTDIGPVSSGASGSSGALGALHCTLFLFDDRLIIVKRPNGVSSGRSLARLGEIEKLLRTNGLNSLKKSGMSCKGVVDVLDVTATDAPGTDIHIYLESPPQDQTDRWNGRPFRSYAVVLPPAPLNLDPTATQAAKKRFLDNLWTIQALYRVKNGRCIAVRSEEKELENRAGRATQATGFYNIYQRTPYLGEAKKPKVVVHVDPSREADAIPFGIVSGPFVIIRLQPMAGGLCRYNVTCNSPDEAEEEHILHSEVVPTRIMQTINQFGLFSFRTSAVSRPSTPTASTRSRAAVFGLDVLSRTLMGGSKSGEVFSFGAGNSGTISGTKKSRGAMSRNSTQTMSTALTESTNRFSYRSYSTAATSLLLEEDSLSIRSARKLTKRGKSPGRATDENTDVVSHAPPDPLARRSHDEPLESVPETVSIFSREPPFADTIYEEEPPPSRGIPDLLRKQQDSEEDSEDEVEERKDTITPTSSTPSKPLPSLPPLPRKPGGPRSANLAPPKLADLQAQDYDVAAALDETIAAFSPPSFPAPLSDEDTPTKPPFEFVIGGGVSRTPTKSSTSSVEPLSIKKKSSIKPRRSGGSFRRIPVHDPPSPSPANNVKHTPSMVRSTRSRAPEKAKDVDHIVVIAKTTKEDLSSARRAVKRIKQEVEILRNDMSRESTPNRLDRSGAVSPSGTRGIVRSPPTRHIVNKAAEARMEEMRQMIERRGAHGDPSHRRSPSSTGDATSALDPSRLEQWTRTVESLVDDADKQIAQAIDQSEGLVKDIALLAVKDNDDSSQDEELEKLQAELKSSQRQTDVLKQLLQDATAENEVLYSTFNQELEEMYQNVHLPEDQAWSAMTNDLIAAKQTRNKLSKENFHYKQKLRIAEQRNEELLAFLQAHGLEPPY